MTQNLYYNKSKKSAECNGKPARGKKTKQSRTEK